MNQSSNMKELFLGAIVMLMFCVIAILFQIRDEARVSYKFQKSAECQWEGRTFQHYIIAECEGE